MSKNLKELTIFLIKFSNFKLLNLLFNFCNESAFYQYLINYTFLDLLHHFVKVYLDNICIHIKMLNNYCSHTW